MKNNSYSDKSLEVSKSYRRKATFEFIEGIIFQLIPTAQMRVKWLRKKKKFALLGEHVHYQPRKYPGDNLRIKIHDNVAIAAEVEFTAHDIINWVFDGMAGKREFVGYVGCIEIHENVFVGAGARILPNVSIGPNAIVAAGAVVTSDVPPGTVVGGVPAKVIGSFDDVMSKRKAFSIAHPDGLSLEDAWREFYACRKGELND
ncbi:MAG: acyltransferase [Clostridia bacterium]|nr:acyltransferase [Clostridia bacterium]